MKESILGVLYKDYLQGAVRSVNDIVLRTQGPDAVDFAKEAIVSRVDWHYRDWNKWFIDTKMAKFLESEGIDLIPILVEHVMQRFYGEYSYQLEDVAEVVIEYSTDAAGAIRKAILEQSLTKSLLNYYDPVIESFLKVQTKILGPWALYAVLGELIIDNANREVTSTLDPTSLDWKLIDSYDAIFTPKSLQEHKEHALEVIHIITTTLEQIELVNQLNLALNHPQVKPRTGAAFLIWTHDIKGTKIKNALEKLSKKYKDEIYLELALKRVKG